MTKLKAVKNDSFESNSITYEIFENEDNQFDKTSNAMSTYSSVKSSFVNAMYKERSESNKRFHHEQIVLSLSISSIFSVSTADSSHEQLERIIRKKSQKRIKKKSNSQSLINLFDDTIEIYEKFISVRKFLKKHKINMSLLN